VWGEGHRTVSFFLDLPADAEQGVAETLQSQVGIKPH